jgi:6-phosphofructokinase
MPRNAFYAQSGGVTAVINASACGVIQTARKHRDRIGTVYAGQNGIIGGLTESLIDTDQLTDTQIAQLKHTPGGFFGSCRYKLKSWEQSQAHYERLIEVFKTHDIGYFFYNGGNDSMDTAHKVSTISAQLGYPVQCIGIPKTIDNDLVHTDNCPGFGSVAKYVAIAIQEASLDLASMAASSTKVFVLEVMGRHAGWITAAAGLAGKTAADAPHILLFPERPLDEAALLARVDHAVNTYGYCSIVVSEGLKNAAGQFIAEAGGVDAFGHAQLGGVAPVIANLIKQKLGYKYHWAVADYLQRSARHIASATDVQQAYALGVKAVELGLAGEHAVMATIERLQATPDAPYQWQVGQVPLAQVANHEKFMPDAFISEDGFGITAACRAYLQPLIAGEDYPPYRDGLPDYLNIPLSQLPLARRQLPVFTV